MYFLQKDDLMLHFTLTGSSDITSCQYLLFCWKKSKESINMEGGFFLWRVEFFKIGKHGPHVY